MIRNKSFVLTQARCFTDNHCKDAVPKRATNLTLQRVCSVRAEGKKDFQFIDYCSTLINNIMILTTLYLL